MNTMHATAAPGLVPDHPSNILDILDRLRLEAKGDVRRMRRAAAERVDALIAFLDATDGDADLEDGDGLEDGWDLEDGGESEPTLGASETRLSIPEHRTWWGPIVESCEPLGSQSSWAAGHLRSDDAEEDVQDEPHDAGYEGNDEPSLGWPEGRENQQGGLFGTDDTEDEHDGREPDDEDSAVDDFGCDDEESDSFYAAGPEAHFQMAAGFEHSAI